MDALLERYYDYKGDPVEVPIARRDVSEMTKAVLDAIKLPEGKYESLERVVASLIDVEYAKDAEMKRLPDLTTNDFDQRFVHRAPDGRTYILCLKSRINPFTFAKNNYSFVNYHRLSKTLADYKKLVDQAKTHDEVHFSRTLYEDKVVDYRVTYKVVDQGQLPYDRVKGVDLLERLESIELRPKKLEYLIDSIELDKGDKPYEYLYFVSSANDYFKTIRQKASALLSQIADEVSRLRSLRTDMAKASVSGLMELVQSGALSAEESKPLIKLISLFKKRITELVGIPVYEHTMRHGFEFFWVESDFLIRPCLNLDEALNLGSETCHPGYMGKSTVSSSLEGKMRTILSKYARYKLDGEFPTKLATTGEWAKTLFPFVRLGYTYDLGGMEKTDVQGISELILLPGTPLCHAGYLTVEAFLDVLLEYSSAKTSETMDRFLKGSLSIRAPTPAPAPTHVSAETSAQAPAQAPAPAPTQAGGIPRSVAEHKYRKYKAKYLALKNGSAGVP